MPILEDGMSSVSEPLCPVCGIDPPAERGACTNCRKDADIQEALNSWIDSTALRSVFSVRGVDLTETLIYPLTKWVTETLALEKKESED